MQRRSGSILLLACALAFLPVGTGAAAQTDDELLQTFRQQVEAYAALHERLERALPPLVPSEHAHVIREARRALAAAIASERQAAQQGDIFTPATAADALRLTPEVNRPFPPHVTHEVPVRILRALPKLPDDLEYRLVGRHLVLWDAHANLIVDYVPFALQDVT